MSEVCLSCEMLINSRLGASRCDHFLPILLFATFCESCHIIVFWSKLLCRRSSYVVLLYSVVLHNSIDGKTSLKKLLFKASSSIMLIISIQGSDFFSKLKSYY